MSTKDINPTPIRWTEKSKKEKVKDFLQELANKQDRSLNYVINDILQSYKRAYAEDYKR